MEDVWDNLLIYVRLSFFKCVIIYFVGIVDVLFLIVDLVVVIDVRIIKWVKNIGLFGWG